LPLEPMPVEVTVKPLSLRKIWRYLTDGEVIPCLREVVKMYDCGNREVVVRGGMSLHLSVVVEREFTFVNVVVFR
jgi:hypothetical protein